MRNNTISLPVSIVTNTVINELSKNSTHGLINENTCRLFHSYKGRTVVGKQYRDIGVRKKEDIGAKELANFYINSANKYITTKPIIGRNSVLAISDTDTKNRSWLNRILYKTYRGLTGFSTMRETTSTAEATIVKGMQDSLSKIVIPETLNIQQKNIIHSKINQWKKLLEDIVFLEMSSYRKGTGLQRLQVHKLLRISGVVDKLIDCTKHVINRAIDKEIGVDTKDAFGNMYIDIFDDLQEMVLVMKKYKNQGGVHRIHNVISTLHKQLVALDAEEFRKNISAPLPQTPEELQQMLIIFEKETSLKYSQQELLKLDVVKQLDGLIESLPAPIPVDIEKEVYMARKSVLYALNLQDSLNILNPIPKINNFTIHLENKDKNVAHAKELIYTLQAVAHSFNTLHTNHQSSQSLYERSKKIANIEPTTFAKLQYIHSIYRILQQPKTVVVDTSIGVDSLSESLHKTYFTLKERLLSLQVERCVHFDEEKAILYAESTEEKIKNYHEETKDFLQSMRVHRIVLALKKELDTTSTNKHSIRLQRFRSGLYNTFLSKSTVASKVVRRFVGTTAVAGAIASGVGAGIAAGIYAGGVGAYNTVLAGIVNAEAISIALTQLGIATQLATTIGISSVVGASASSAGIAYALSGQCKKVKNTHLYEDFAYIRNAFGKRVHKSSLVPEDSTPKNISSEGIVKNIPFREYLAVENFIHKEKELTREDFLTHIKDALHTYFPVGTKVYPSGFIKQIIRLCEELDSLDTNKWHLYEALFFVVLPYLNNTKNTEATYKAYEELSHLLDRRQEGNIIFVQHSERPNMEYNETRFRIFEKTLRNIAKEREIANSLSMKKKERKAESFDAVVMESSKQKKQAKKDIRITDSIVTNLANQKVKGKYREDVKRLVHSYRGRVISGQYYQGIGIFDGEDSKAKERANFCKNARDKFISAKIIEDSATVLTLSSTDIKPRNIFMRGFYRVRRGVSGFSKMKNTTHTAEIKIVKKMRNRLSCIAIPSTIDEVRKQEIQRIIDQWERLLEDVVYMEMRSYRVGTGLQRFRLHKLLRVSEIMDTLVEFAQYSIERGIKEVQGLEVNDSFGGVQEDIFTQLRFILDSLMKYKKQGGMHRFHNFVSDLYKEIQKGRKEQYTIEKVMPTTPASVQKMLSSFDDETKFRYSKEKILRLEVVQQLDLLIKSIPAPITKKMQIQMVRAREYLLKALGVEDAKEVLSPAPKLSTFALFETSKEYQHNIEKAKEVLDIIKSVSQMFSQESNTEDGIHSLYDTGIRMNVLESSMQERLQYIQSIHTVLYHKDNIEDEDTSLTKEEHVAYTVMKKRLLSLQERCVERLSHSTLREYTNASIEVVRGMRKEAEDYLHSVHIQKIEKIIQKQMNTVSLNKHSVRIQRLRSGLRKIFLSKSTVSSKIIRRLIGTSAFIGATAGSIQATAALGIFFIVLQIYNGVGTSTFIAGKGLKELLRKKPIDPIKVDGDDDDDDDDSSMDSDSTDEGFAINKRDKQNILEKSNV